MTDLLNALNSLKKNNASLQWEGVSAQQAVAGEK